MGARLTISISGVSRRSLLRLRGPVATLATVALLAGCGGGGTDNSLSDNSLSSTATVQSAGAATPGAGSRTAPSSTLAPVTAPADATATSSNVRSEIVETPSSLLAAAFSTLPAGYTVTPSGLSIIAEVKVPEIAIYEDSAGTVEKIRLKNPQPSGAPLVLLVDGQTQSRAKVLLPIRPNGSVGWINLADVVQKSHDFKLVVTLAAFKLQAFKGDNVILDTKIGIGESETPTPNGRYYIKELLRPPDPTGVYGTYAYGLSGFSPVLTNFNGGTGVLGIHGTNRPDLLGQHVSKGCIRIRNEEINKLAKILPLGTPVFVEA